MKKTVNLKSIALSIAVAAGSMTAIAPMAVQADSVSGNMGVVSKYVFRGVPQAGASGQGGFDYESDSGIYAGVWGSELDGQGLETDVYAGYGTEVSGVSLGAGVTHYGYTTDMFDTSYTELNLSAGFGPVSLGVDLGSHADQTIDGKEEDESYTVVSVSYEMGGFSATLGSASNFISQTDHTWADFTYGATVAEGTDASMSLIYSSEEASGQKDDKGEPMGGFFLVVGLTKSFDL